MYVLRPQRNRIHTFIHTHVQHRGLRETVRGDGDAVPTAHTQTHTHTSKDTFTHTYMHTMYTHACIHTYIQTNMHAYIHRFSTGA